MSMDAIRGLVQMAAGLGDLTVARATETARDLAHLAGLDEQLKKKKLAKQVTAIAQDLLDAAEENRVQLLSVIRAEVENALSRSDVARLADLEAARAGLAALMVQVEELSDVVRSATGHSRTRPVPSTVAPSAEVSSSTSPPPAVPPRRRPARTSFASATEATAPATTGRPASPKKAPAKKATAKKAPAKKAPTAEAPDGKAARKAPVKKGATPAARKAPVKKGATPAARKAPVKKGATPAARKAPVKKGATPAAARKAPVKKGATTPAAGTRKATP